MSDQNFIKCAFCDKEAAGHTYHGPMTCGEHEAKGEEIDNKALDEMESSFANYSYLEFLRET